MFLRFLSFFGGVIGKAGSPNRDKSLLDKKQQFHISIGIWEVSDPFVCYTEKTTLRFTKTVYSSVATEYNTMTGSKRSKTGY